MAAGNEQNFLNYLGISLSVTSDRLSPDEISQAIGIQPTYTRQRGALTRTGLMRRPEFDLYEWQFRRQFDLKPGNCAAQDFEKFINEFLDQIKNSTPQIRALSEHHNVTVSLVYHVDEMPYIGLTRQQVLAVAALGARLDYDLMVEESGPDKTEDHDYPVEVG
jgi:Domain of unknown function (DUF4279)